MGSPFRRRGMMLHTYMLTGVVLFLGLSLLQPGCTPAVSSRGEDRRGREGAVPQKEDFDPLALEAPEVIPRPPPMELPAVSPSDQSNPQTMATGFSASASRTTVPEDTLRVSQGYRVQIYAGSDLQHAEALQEEAQERFAKARLESPIYIDYESPYYKVRVGNFASQAKADTLAQKLRQLDFEGAWVVKCLINQTGPQ